MCDTPLEPKLINTWLTSPNPHTHTHFVYYWQFGKHLQSVLLVGWRAKVMDALLAVDDVGVV